MNNSYSEQDVDVKPELLLPEDIEIVEFLGKGGRTYVYKARLDHENVVVKVYRKEVVAKYQDKYQVDIAEFEHQRNKALYDLAEIKAYIAKPYRVYPFSSEYTHSVIQEYVTGKTMKELIAELGYLPEETLRAGYTIVKQSEAHGIHDLDISVGNIMVNDRDGDWKPKLYDFNLMPQYLFPPNPIVWLAIKLGIRSKSHRDYRSLKNWKKRGENRVWVGRN